jgi:hypothetical protein
VPLPTRLGSVLLDVPVLLLVPLGCVMPVAPVLLLLLVPLLPLPLVPLLPPAPELPPALCAIAAVLSASAATPANRSLIIVLAPVARAGGVARMRGNRGQPDRVPIDNREVQFVRR